MKKGKLTTLILILVLIAGLSLLLYPTFSDWWNSRVQSRAIASYSETLGNMGQNDYEPLWEAAKAHNETLTGRDNPYLLSEQQAQNYAGLLNVGGDGIMGYVEVPAINCVLPVYHGTSEDVLNVAVGHLEWSSLPTGGSDTHCVISGHRGLPSARLFTDLDQLILGDIILLHVLDQTFSYEVDQILIVEPDETDALLIEEGKDLLSLVTCTPYGVNSHRLLVRGHRVANEKETVAVRVTADAVQVEPLLVAVVLAVPILILILTALFISDRGNKKKS